MFSSAFLPPFDPPLPTHGATARSMVFTLPQALVADLDALAGPGGNRVDALGLALTALVAGMAHRIRRHYDQGPARRRGGKLQ